jgi:DNA-binding NarL/FixJ family response regulator
MTLKVRLLIDDLSLRRTLCDLLEQDQDLVVLPSTPSADGVGADLVLVDGEADVSAAAQLIRSTKAAHPETRTMMLVGRPTNENMSAAFGAGASGVVSKVQPPRELAGAVRLVAQGGSYICLAVAKSTTS